MSSLNAMLTKTLSVLSIATFLTGYALATSESTVPQPGTNAAKQLDQKDLDVVIYSSKGCFSCHRVKELFDEKKIKYNEKVVDNNPVLLAEMKAKTEKETVPQVIINGEHVGSYRHLMLGGLDEVLEKLNSPADKQDTKSVN